MATYEDLEKLAKRANQRLRQLEKSKVHVNTKGMTAEEKATLPSAANLSSAYRELKARAYDQRGMMRITKEGNIAFRRDFKNMTPEQMADLAQALEEFFSYKTTTVKAARQAYERSYATYQAIAEGKKEGKEGGSYTPLTPKQYATLWTSTAAKTFGYEKMIRISKATGEEDFDKLSDALAESIAQQEDTGNEIAEDELIANALEYFNREE